MPVAIHWSSVTNRIARTPTSRHDGLPRRTNVLLAMTESVL